MQQFETLFFTLIRAKKNSIIMTRTAYLVFGLKNYNLLSNCTRHTTGTVCNGSRRTSGVQRPMKMCLFRELKLIGDYLT